MDKNIRVRIAVILIKDNKILLIRQEKAGHSYWLVPGGGVNFGEEISSCAIREIKEETNLEVKLGKLLFINESIAPSGNKHLINLFFLGEIESGEIKLAKEDNLKELSFIDIEKLSFLELHPPIGKFIQEAYLKEFKVEAKYLGNFWI